MAVLLSPVGGVAAQFFTNNGVPLSGGKIYTYAAGTSTPQATYTSALGSIQHSNPIVLDAAGRVPTGEIWLTDGLTYKFVLQDANSVLIATYDNIVGINSNFVNFTNQQEIQIATAGQTVFNLTTTQYQPGTNSLSVFVDGVNQYGPGAQYSYLETDSDTVTFVSGLHVGAEVKFTTSQLNTSASADAGQISYTAAGLGAITTNVEAELRKTYHSDNYADVTTAITAADTTLLQANSGDGSWLDQGGVGMGVTYNIVPAAPVNIQVENEESSVPYGVYRKYEHDTTNGTLTKSSQLIVNDVTVTNTTTSNSAVGMNLSTQIHVDSPGNFAWHNFQNYVESDAGAPTEIAGTYTFVEASNGASPEGAFYGAMASGTVPYNLMYGMQVSTIDTNTGGVYGSGAKTLSIRHLGTRSAPNGSILFGSGGFVQGYTATNKGERNENENWASGEGGGSFTYAFMADNTDRTKGAFTAGKSNLIVGSTITGASSGQTAVLRGINITSGSLAGNDAAGTIYVSAASGAFTAGEALQIGGVTAATNGSGNLLTPAGTIGTGFCAANITANAFSVTDSAYGAYWRVTGTGQVGRAVQVFTLADATPSVKYGDYYQTATDTAGTNITNLLNGVAGQEITIVGGGGTGPSVIKNNANIVLASGDWTATNNKVLKLLFRGVWVEISRT